MAGEIKKQNLENRDFLNPKHINACTSGHYTKGSEELFHSENITKWVNNYFEENPNSDGIQIVMKSETSFTVNNFVMTFYMK